MHIQFIEKLLLFSSGHDNQVKAHMLDIMGFAITDSGSVSQPLLDIILECLLEKSQKMNPSAFELAKDLFRRTSGVIEQFLMMVSFICISELLPVARILFQSFKSKVNVQ